MWIYEVGIILASFLAAHFYFERNRWRKEAFFLRRPFVESGNYPPVRTAPPPPKRCGAE